MSLPNLYVEDLMADVMVFGDWPLGSDLGLDEVMRVGPA